MNLRKNDPPASPPTTYDILGLCEPQARAIRILLNRMNSDHEALARVAEACGCHTSILSSMCDTISRDNTWLP